MKTEAELQTEVAAETVAQPRKLTSTERMDEMERAIHQLAENQNTLIQSLQNLNKQGATGASLENAPAPQLPPQTSYEVAPKPGLDINSLAPILQLLMRNEPQADPFAQAGKMMFEKFAESLFKTAGKQIAKQVVSHEY